MTSAPDSMPPRDAQRWRPQWHFTPAVHWMNDPNGLVWHDGEYHLFFQYNPFGDQWGHMSWGHAVSTDLLHWRELAVAIPEDAHAAIFSGSIVVDERNTSGFGRDGIAPMVAIYTAAIHWGDQVQHLAYSLDRGRHWTKFDGNPVLARGMKDFRDPKVFWHEATARWVMVVSLAHECRVAFYASPDLRTWTLLSEFGPAGVASGLWECPDLLALPVEGGDEALWLFKVDVFDGHPSGGSGAQVFIGRFDGTTFTPLPGETGRFPDPGSDFYAAVAWGQLPAAQGRQVWIGWMNCHRYAKLLPTAPWRGAMSEPRELALRRDARGQVELLQRPVRELDALRETPHWRVAAQAVDAAPVTLPGATTASFELCLSVLPAAAGEAGVEVCIGPGQGTRIGVDRARGSVYVDRSRSGFAPDDPLFAGRRDAALRPGATDAPVLLRILVDVASVEVFVGDGEVTLTEQILPDARSLGIALFAQGGVAQVGEAEFWTLRPAMHPVGARDDGAAAAGPASGPPG